MDYRTLDQKVKEQVKGNRLKLTILLFVCSFFALFLGLLPSLLALWIANEMLFIVLGVLVIVVMPAIQNTVYAVFLKTVRKESFTKEDIVYSIHRIGTHLGVYLLMYFMQLGFGAVINMLVGSIPSVYNILSTLLNVFTICVSVLCAFAIFEGAKGMFSIIGGSFRMVMKYWKLILLFALPFLIWILVVQFGYNMVIANLIGTTALSVEEVIASLVNNPVLTQIIVTILGVYLIQYIGSAIFQVNMFSAYANIFDEDFLNEYPTLQKRTIRGQEIDIDKI